MRGECVCWVEDDTAVLTKQEISANGDNVHVYIVTQATLQGVRHLRIDEVKISLLPSGRRQHKPARATQKRDVNINLSMLSPISTFASSW